MNVTKTTTGNEWWEVQFSYGSCRGGQSFPSHAEAIKAAIRMIAAGMVVTSIHPAPLIAWTPPAVAG